VIYLKTFNGRSLLILEQANIDAIRRGMIAASPDGELSIAFTPDADWLASAIQAAAQARMLDSDVLSNLHSESMKRETVTSRPRHPMVPIIANGEPVKPAPEGQRN
jgi:hypothetical protein